MRVLLIAGMEIYDQEDGFPVRLSQYLQRFRQNSSFSELSPIENATEDKVFSIPSSNCTPKERDRQVHVCSGNLTPSLSCVILVAALEAKGVPYDIITGISFDNPAEVKTIENMLYSEDCAIVGLSTTFISTNRLLQELCRQIKLWSPKSKLIVGGPFLFGNESGTSMGTKEYSAVNLRRYQKAEGS